MSSNIRIEKTCEHCKSKFIAKTIYTRFCSHYCNRKAYKLSKLNEKVKNAKRSLAAVPTGRIQDLFDFSAIKEKELLTINEASAFLCITQVTLRRWMQEGIVKSSRIGKKHLIHRSHLNRLLK
jgi:excisionase family DNA binding protein